MRAGFTLVELSIVLVIVGLLAGGIMTGQHLIRASEIRAIGTEYNRYVTATNAFDKYQAFPGDLKLATSFWGKDSTNCTGDSGAAATPGACNGNGDGNVTYGTTASAPSEAFQYWKHLVLAGLVEGSYSGLSGPTVVSGSATQAVLVTNVPVSKTANSGWATGSQTVASATGGAFFSGVLYANYFIWGGASTNSFPTTAMIKPEEAFNLDDKLDDGNALKGRLQAYNWSGCTNATGDADTAARYAYTSTAIACALLFPRAF